MKSGSLKVYQTPRLLLRQWKDSDREPFAEMSSDSRVMEHFPSLLSRSESDAVADKISGLIHERGWGFWALEEKSSGRFIGFTGLHIPIPELPFSPCVEIGWRLMFSDWGKGFASEAAAKALEVAFENIKLQEVVAFATIGNFRSHKVMERLGMRKDYEFEHPGLDLESPHRKHVLYRISKRSGLSAGNPRTR
ncbi:MAG: GNAT family N-acetyltransferase [Fibrobacteria bacterium]